MNTAQTDKIWFKTIVANQTLVAKLQKIKLIVFDVDGTLTDASIYVDDHGEGGRIFNIQDGYAFRPIANAGITTALMSGKKNISTIERGKALGIPEELCIVGSLTKPAAIKILQERLSITAEQTLMMGDDHLDVQVIQAGTAALFACPENTPFYYHDTADLVIPRTGGNGAARLLLDLVLFVHNAHFSQDLIVQSIASQTLLD